VDELQRVYQGAVPQDVAQMDERVALAEVMALAEGAVAGWAREVRPSTAHGAYLEFLALGEGLFRQGDEVDISLRTRMATPPLAITPTDILTALQQIVDANGGGTVYLQELPRDSLYLNRQRCLNRGWRVGSAGHAHMVIALIPASADCRTACLDALRTKRAAGKNYSVEEYA